MYPSPILLIAPPGPDGQGWSWARGAAEAGDAGACLRDSLHRNPALAADGPWTGTFDRVASPTGAGLFVFWDGTAIAFRDGLAIPYPLRLAGPAPGYGALARSIADSLPSGTPPRVANQGAELENGKAGVFWSNILSVMPEPDFAQDMDSLFFSAFGPALWSAPPSPYGSEAYLNVILVGASVLPDGTLSAPRVLLEGTDAVIFSRGALAKKLSDWNAAFGPALLRRLEPLGRLADVIGQRIYDNPANGRPTCYPAHVYSRLILRDESPKSAHELLGGARLAAELGLPPLS